MATEFIDSFGIYVTNSVSTGASAVSLYERWTGIGDGNHSLSVAAGKGARGNPALWIPFGGAIYKTLSHQQTYTVGFTLNMSSNAGVGGGDLIQLQNTAQILCSLMVNADGSVLVYANNTTSLVVCTLAAGFILANTNCFIELKSTISGTSNVNVAGTVNIYNAAGALLATATGNVNTGLSTNSLATLTGLFGMNVVPAFAAVYNRVGLLAGCTTNGQAYISDLYINTSAGTVNTGFLGPVIIDPYPLPASDGGTLQWTPLSGAVHFSQINELPSDGDTSYNAAPSAGLTDAYGWEVVTAFSGSVHTVQISYCARSTDEGPCAIKSCIGPTGALAQSPAFPLPGNYNYWHFAFDLDPTTGLPWTVAGFNANQKGVTRSS